MDKKYIIYLALFLILFLVGLFYWHEWRPYEIRKSCFEKNWHAAYNIASREGPIRLASEIDRLTHQLFSGYYIDCLRENGLKE